jgi:protein SCO1/2
MKKVVLTIVLLLFGWLSTPADSSEPTVFAEIDAAFDLVNGHSDPVSLAEFRGKNVLVTFGFTHCQHICPMIAANMARALKSTDKDAIGIFISVDTERDSAKQTHAYASGFSDRMIGLGGTYEQIAAAAMNFGVTFVVTKSEDNYTVQHTPSIFLIGPDGEVLEVFAMNAASDDIAAAMR